jgi:Ca2+-binding RTX toxin-like protein
VKCDAGHDVVKADLADRVTHGCEEAVFYDIERRPSDAEVDWEDVLVPHHLVLNADDSGRALRGRRNLPNRMTGGFSDDVLVGGRRGDVLDGRSGYDTLRAGRGDDRVYARDGYPDTIHCGHGDDWIVADQRDAVPRSCERVERRHVSYDPASDAGSPGR